MAAEAFSDYDLEIAEKGAMALARVITEEIDRRVIEAAIKVSKTDNEDEQTKLKGRIEALQDLKQWMIVDGE